MRRTILTIAAIGAIALTGCGSDSSSSPAKGKPASARVDSKDPTPGTQGRLTASEERKIAEVADWAVERAISTHPSFNSFPESVQEDFMTTYMQTGLAWAEIDVSSIKIRDRLATDAGFPVDQASLPKWRRASTQTVGEPAAP
jgi:hypothetical protein